jgi:hypothetical protein
MDARGGRATSGAARIENGQTFDRPEIKTDRVSNSQATEHLEQTRDGRDRGEGEEMTRREIPTLLAILFCVLLATVLTWWLSMRVIEYFLQNWG